MFDCGFQFGDVEPQFCFPVVQAVPVKCAVRLRILFAKYSLSRLFRNAMFLAIHLGNQSEPEVVIKVQVQQGTIHVEHYCVDKRPGRH